MIGASIVFGITIIIVVFLFLLQLNKSTNAMVQVVVKINTQSELERDRLLHHINKLEDRIQTGDAKQAASLNKEQPDQPGKPEKPKRVDIGTATGLEVAHADMEP